MNGAIKLVRSLALVATCALSLLVASQASASDATEVKAAVDKWVSAFNQGDFTSFLAACAPRTAIVDGFPPYAWHTCAEWIADYESNNKALQATHGTLSIGTPIYEELNGGRAYLIYPATFTDTQQGKPVVYKGTWTMTLQKTPNGWVFTGSASAWGVNSL